jgi:hypothetical protein
MHHPRFSAATDKGEANTYFNSSSFEYPIPMPAAAMVRTGSVLPGVRGNVVKSRIERDLIPAVEAASKHRAVSRSASA